MDGFACIVLRGELDRADELGHTLECNRGPFVVVDLSGVTAISREIVDVLLAELQGARAGGRRVFVVPGPPVVHEALARSGAQIELVRPSLPNLPPDGSRPHGPPRRSPLVDLLVGAGAGR